MNKKLLIGILGIVAVVIFLILVGQETPTVTPGNPKSLFGIFPSQKGSQQDWSEETLNDMFQKAKEGGIGIMIWTTSWGVMEPSLNKYDWPLFDYMIMKTNEHYFKMSLSLELAQIMDNPKYPEGITFTSFDEPAFIGNFTRFTRDLVTRYKGKIDYLWIGQEVDFYLYNHPEQKESLIKLFREFQLIEPFS